MTTDLLTLTELKKHFIIGHTGIVQRKPITVKAVDGISFSVQEGGDLRLGRRIGLR